MTLPPPPPKPGPSLNRPIVGIAISVCAFVLTFLLGFVVWCGPGRSLGGGQATLATKGILCCFGASIVSFVGCLIWLATNAARKAMSD